MLRKRTLYDFDSFKFIETYFMIQNIYILLSLNIVF